MVARSVSCSSRSVVESGSREVDTLIAPNPDLAYG